MLKDEAIREGLRLPDKADIKRMCLSDDEVKEIKALHKAGKTKKK